MHAHIKLPYHFSVRNGLSLLLILIGPDPVVEGHHGVGPHLLPQEDPLPSPRHQALSDLDQAVLVWISLQEIVSVPELSRVLSFESHFADYFCADCHRILAEMFFCYRKLYCQKVDIIFTFSSHRPTILACLAFTARLFSLNFPIRQVFKSG